MGEVPKDPPRLYRGGLGLLSGQLLACGKGGCAAKVDKNEYLNDIMGPTPSPSPSAEWSHCISAPSSLPSLNLLFSSSRCSFVTSASTKHLLVLPLASIAFPRPRGVESSINYSLQAGQLPPLPFPRFVPTDGSALASIVAFPLRSGTQWCHCGAPRTGMITTAVAPTRRKTTNSSPARVARQMKEQDSCLPEMMATWIQMILQ